MTANLFCLFSCLLVQNPANHIQYQNPSEVSESYLAEPHGIAFDTRGYLYLVDSKLSLVFHWDAGGHFLGTFARKGQGPGELQFPTCIASSGNKIWVTDTSRKLHIFSQDGVYETSVSTKVGVRVLKAVGPKLALIGSRALNPGSGTNSMAFSLVHLETGKVEEIKAWPNETAMGVEDGMWRWKAFGADVDVQALADGTVIFGFSQDPMLYQLGSNNKPKKFLEINLPQMKPTKEEQSYIKNMSFPGSGGKRYKLDKTTSWIWDFSQEKAPYTHFLLKEDKILLALSPHGGIRGIGGGFSKGSYAVIDRKTGEVTNRGNFEYPQDSLIFFEDGRCLGLVLEDDGEYEIKTIQLKGF